MLFLAPDFEDGPFFSTWSMPTDSPMLSEYSEKEWTDDDGVYHRYVTEVIHFDVDASRKVEPKLDQHVHKTHTGEQSVIDATDSATSTPPKLPLHVEKGFLRF